MERIHTGARPMPEVLLASQNLHDALVDLHNGLDTLMDNLICKKNYQQAEVIARQMDNRLNHIVSGTRIPPLPVRRAGGRTK